MVRSPWFDAIIVADRNLDADLVAVEISEEERQRSIFVAKPPFKGWPDGLANTAFGLQRQWKSRRLS